MNSLDHILTTFNSYHPRLQFTHESEVDGSINFLDVTIVRKDNVLLTNWYLHLAAVNYYSSHPLKYKTNTIIGLVDRAILLSDK